MRKLLFLPLLFICSVAFAKEPSLSEVLEWKYGLVARTCQADQNDKSENPKMVICGWKSATPQPDEAQIAQDTIDYKAFLVQADLEKKAKKDAALLKLKITEQDFLDLLDFYGISHK